MLNRVKALSSGKDIAMLNWGQALSSGKDIFVFFILRAFLWIRPDPFG
jgi:hypothetical protein